MCDILQSINPTKGKVTLERALFFQCKHYFSNPLILIFSIDIVFSSQPFSELLRSIQSQ